MKGRTTSGGAWYAAAAPGGGGGGLAMDLRNGRLLMLCFVFVSTLLMLASTTVLQPKPGRLVHVHACLGQTACKRLLRFPQQHEMRLQASAQVCFLCEWTRVVESFASACTRSAVDL